MISIIICSIRPDMVSSLSRNIAETIGVEYELIVVDNRNTEHGICNVYNRAASRARYETLCFMHEDVEFLEAGWGARVLVHFAEDTELGVIGLAGARFKSLAPSGWMTGGREKYNCAHLWQGCSAGSGELIHFNKEYAEKRSRVCTLDGVWICARKSVWSKLRFNEALRYFHFYDVDFALRASQSYGVAVIYDVELLHFSGGHFDQRWMEQALEYWSTCQVPLPVALDGLDKRKTFRQEGRGIRFWLKFLRKVKAPMSLRWRWLRACRIQAYPWLWMLAFKFLFYYPVKFFK